MSLHSILWVILLTLTPTLELRASIPYALLVAKWPVLVAGVVGILANTALAPLVWVFVDKVMHLFLRIGFIDRVYQRWAARKRDKLQAYVQRWGIRRVLGVCRGLPARVPVPRLPACILPRVLFRRHRGHRGRRFRERGLHLRVPVGRSGDGGRAGALIHCRARL
ncbi:MAG: small multi-drug export protein [Deltaproteobacteria bacterium]|nr:small multi-drug export protein [Deltaproteobacteria bacterium]